MPGGQQRQSVFLDAGVLLSYFRGEQPAASLFQEEFSERFRFVINPLILQEIVALGSSDMQSELVGMLEERRLSMLDIDFVHDEGILSRIRDLRNKSIHLGDVISYLSAENCEYIITDDKDLAHMAHEGGPSVLSPENFLSRAQQH